MFSLALLKPAYRILSQFITGLSFLRVLHGFLLELSFFMESLILSILYYQLFCSTIKFCILIAQYRNVIKCMKMSSSYCFISGDMLFKHETLAISLFHVAYFANLLVPRKGVLVLVFLNVMICLISWSL